VSQAASRRNVTLVLRDADMETAMTRLHDEWFIKSRPVASVEAAP
jgi:hypothetical protein